MGKTCLCYSSWSNSSQPLVLSIGLHLHCAAVSRAPVTSHHSQNAGSKAPVADGTGTWHLAQWHHHATLGNNVTQCKLEPALRVCLKRARRREKRVLCEWQDRREHEWANTKRAGIRWSLMQNLFSYNYSAGQNNFGKVPTLKCLNNVLKWTLGLLGRFLSWRGEFTMCIFSSQNNKLLKKNLEWPLRICSELCMIVVEISNSDVWMDLLVWHPHDPFERKDYENRIALIFTSHPDRAGQSKSQSHFSLISIIVRVYGSVFGRLALSFGVQKSVERCAKWYQYQYFLAIIVHPYIMTMLPGV